MAKINQQRKKVINAISKFMATLWALISIVLFTMLLLVNILPIKYMIIILSIYIPFFIIMFFLLWWSKIRKGIKIVINIIAIIIMSGFSFGIFYMYKTMNFMERIQSKDYQIEEYYVMTLKDSSYNKINDIDNKEIGVLPLNNDNYDLALNKLDELVTADKKEYQDFISLGQDLLDKK